MNTVLSMKYVLTNVVSEVETRVVAVERIEVVAQCAYLPTHTEVRLRRTIRTSCKARSGNINIRVFIFIAGEVLMKNDEDKGWIRCPEEQDACKGWQQVQQRALRAHCELMSKPNTISYHLQQFACKRLLLLHQ